MKLKKLLKEQKYKEEDFITSADVIKANKKILGFSASEDDRSGSLEWWKKGYDGLMWATPSWDENWGKIPFDINDQNDLAKHLGDLDFTKNPKKYIGNKEQQLKDYFDAVKIGLTKLLKEVPN